MVIDKGNVIGMMLIPKSEDKSFFYNIVIPSKNQNFQIPSKLNGQITENRAKELTTLKKAEQQLAITF